MEGKFNDLDEKSSRVRDSEKTTKQRGMLEMKSLINQFKTPMEGITNKLNQVQEYPEVKIRLINYYIQILIKKKCNHVSHI
jgi:hypothetical protein